MTTLATLSNPAGNDSANTVGGSSSTAGAGNNNNVERRCENADCNVIKLVSMVPKRKITQFVTEPSVMEKPMLINGFTTVFQVEGSSAKLSDLKNPNPTASPQPKSIFRIVPNTHAHIVNYVVVDADGDSLRKINEGDPATMRKLLESQKVSADQMLKKLMAGHGPSVPIVCSASPASTSVNSVSSATSSNARSVVTANTFSTTATTTTSNATNANIRTNVTPVTGNTAPNGSAKSSAIQLPMRMHPNLKITAVVSRDTIGQLVEPNTGTQQSIQVASSAVPPTVPLITPIPLANLQSSPAPSISTQPADKSNIDKMQAELAELRRTVAMLAEAMPMNPQAQKALQQTTQQRGVAVKRQRIN
ncbi:uncharacterized protein LOC126759611 [Bactrocera neohumeralis]|uniref:uncharacterized protein LOC126759611 n=1 Tax=Bactrocera neohumeralis TaxID=98809 RepID=UPI00216610E6|nr:uncharacterized protein LOC126759611 [Bactrocera neohumeralis]